MVTFFTGRDRQKAAPRGLVFSTNPYAEQPDQKLTFIPLYFIHSATKSTGGA